MSADAVDFRFNVLHDELVFRHQVHFVLKTVKKHTGRLFNRSAEEINYIDEKSFIKNILIRLSKYEKCAVLKSK